MNKMHYVNPCYSGRVSKDTMYSGQLKEVTCLKCLAKNIKRGQIWKNVFNDSIKILHANGRGGVSYRYSSGALGGHTDYWSRRVIARSCELVK